MTKIEVYSYFPENPYEEGLAVKSETIKTRRGTPEKLDLTTFHPRLRRIAEDITSKLDGTYLGLSRAYDYSQDPIGPSRSMGKFFIYHVEIDYPKSPSDLTIGLRLVDSASVRVLEKSEYLYIEWTNLNTIHDPEKVFKAYGFTAICHEIGQTRYDLKTGEPLKKIK